MRRLFNSWIYWGVISMLWLAAQLLPFALGR